MTSPRAWQVAVHRGARRLSLRAQLSGNPPLHASGSVPTVQEALEQMDTWFALCPDATFQLVVSSDAAPPETHSTHSRHLALHFVATALEPNLVPAWERSAQPESEDEATAAEAAAAE